MSSNQSGEGEIRRAIIEADLVDCMVALPGQLFYSTQIPVCLWFLVRSKHDGKRRDRRRQTLFIDARKLGSMVSKVNRELTEKDIARIAGTYHAWRGDAPDPRSREGGNPVGYGDIPGFCRSASTDEIAAHGFVLTPGRYVGAEEAKEEGESFEEKLSRLVPELQSQFAESAKLERSIRDRLAGMGYVD
jgi:type I restriction enzyme M protein